MAHMVEGLPCKYLGIGSGCVLGVLAEALCYDDYGRGALIEISMYS